MRFKLELELENERFPTDYRPIIISLFKHSLSEYENGKYFNTYYDIGKEKPFTFAVGIPNSKFSKEAILVPNRKINITFSTSDMSTGIVFFNSLMRQKYKPYPLANQNKMTIKNIVLEKEKVVTTNTINVSFKSPLCVRQHNKKTNKDIYYSFQREGFDKTLRKVIELQISKSKTFDMSILEDFSMTPVQCKKTVVLHHSQFIEVTVGRFNITGNIALLNYLYANGIASRKSSGFGLFEII